MKAYNRQINKEINSFEYKFFMIIIINNNLHKQTYIYHT